MSNPACWYQNLLDNINETPRYLPCCVVYLDVDKDHDAGGDVEGAEGGVHHIADLLTHLVEVKNTK